MDRDRHLPLVAGGGALPLELGDDWAPPAAGGRLATRGRPRRRRSLAGLLLAALAALLAVWLGRGLIGSYLDRIEWLRAVHPDRSSADAGVRRQAEPLTYLVYRTADGREVRALVGEERLGTFLREQVRDIEGHREALRSEARALLEAAVRPVFAGMDGRVGDFVDWYLGWDTGYRLLAVALGSAANHALAPEVMTLRDAVALDLERYVERHYQALVLRPELSDPALRRAYAETLATLHGRVLAVVARTDQAFQSYLAREGTLLDGSATVARSRVELDWAAQVRRLAVPDPGAGASGALRGLALATGGALAGKAVGTAAGRALAEGIGSRAVAPAGARLGGRLAAPLAARLGSTLAGASAGAAGGPVGLALGGAVGLGVDYLVNDVTRRLQRDALERDVGETVASQTRAWEGLLGDSLEQAVDVWMDDLAALLVARAR